MPAAARIRAKLEDRSISSTPLLGWSISTAELAGDMNHPKPIELPSALLFPGTFSSCANFPGSKQPSFGFSAPPAPSASSAVKGFGCGYVALHWVCDDFSSASQP
jgi:hypothetical protein